MNSRFLVLTIVLGLCLATTNSIADTVVITSVIPGHEFRGEVVTEILGLTILGTNYNVEFKMSTVDLLYGSPPTFTFTTLNDAVLASNAVISVLNAFDPEVRVGGLINPDVLGAEPSLLAWFTQQSGAFTDVRFDIPFTLHPQFPDSTIQMQGMTNDPGIAGASVYEHFNIILDPIEWIVLPIPDNMTRDDCCGTYAVFTPVTSVPEPGTLFLLGSGLIGLGVFRKRFTGSL